MTEVRLGDKSIPFIYQGDELIHPNPVKDGLVLWYDFSGRTNSDAQRDVAEDLSGNGNHGELQNFNFTAESGYDKNKLLFDGVDDFIDTPIEELNLDPDNMTAQIDNVIYSYNDDQVMYTKLNDEKTGLERIEVGGRNLLPSLTSEKWSGFVETLIEVIGDYELIFKAGSNPVLRLDLTLEPNTNYTMTFNSDYQRYYIYRKENGENTTIVRSISEGSDVFTFNTEDLTEFQLMINARSDRFGNDRRVWNPKLEKGTIATDWTPAPEDITVKTTTIQKQKIQSYKLYDRALTEEEIAHNYAIEKERFNIE